MQFDRTGGKLAHFSCNMTVASPSPGHHGGEGSRRPTGRWQTFPRAHWPSRRSALPRRVHVSSLATTAAKGLAALPDGGAPFHGHHGGEGSRRPTGRWHAYPPGITAAKGLAALPDGGAPIPWASRRRRVSPPYRTVARLSPGHHGGEGSRRPTGRWQTFPRAHWPSRRSALPRRVHVSSLATTAAKGLAALPAGGAPFHGHHGGEGSRRPTGRWHAYPPGITAAKGLAALPDGGAPIPWASRRRRVSPPYRTRGAPSHGHIGRADARPSLGEGMFLHVHHGGEGPDGGMFLPGHHGGEGARRPTGRWYAFPQAHWPSILLRQGYGGQGRSALSRRVHVSSLATTAAQGLVALPNCGAPIHGLIGRASSFPVIPGKSIHVTMTGQNSPRWDSYCRPRPPPRHCASLPIPDIRIRNLDR